MMSSRGMGAVSSLKTSKGVRKARRDDTDFTEYAEGGKVNAAGGGLYANIAAKKKRIASGSGEKMRSAGSSGAPKKSDFANAAKTASYKNGGLAKQAATAIAMKEAGKKPKKMSAGGGLKEVPEDNVGLSKLPTGVRNKMGYMKEGGETKSKVNEAGNYTKPELRKRIFNAVKAEATAGTGAGEWSARKAQMVAQRYKKAGGGYRD